MDVILPLDVAALRDEFRQGRPFPHLVLDPFLDPAFAREAADAFPTFEAARQQGRSFQAVHENRKVQITDADRFPAAVARLHEAMSAPAFLETLSEITGIPRLRADPRLVGGGMHETGPRGRLDVHVDFNIHKQTGWHRRLNILVYLNPEWYDKWGGALELWDREVRTCVRTVQPALNRCVLFETSEYSFHGVTPVTCPPDQARRSFAAYYYTEEAPTAWDGTSHTTIFRTRPRDRVSTAVRRPVFALRQALQRAGRRLRRGLTRAD